MTGRRHAGAWFLVLAGALQLACPKRPEVQSETPKSAQELFDAGVKYLNGKKYDKAIDAFQRITLEYATTRYASDAQFYLAETYLAQKDYAQAATEYEFLTTNYASSPFTEEASYKTALCYFRKSPTAGLDQSDLAHAQDLLELFRERYLNSKYLPDVDALEAEIATRSAQKEFDAAMMYARAGEYASAKVYFEHLLQQYPKATIRDEVRFELALCYQNAGEPDKARQIFTELSQAGVDPNLKARVARALEKMK